MVANLASLTAQEGREEDRGKAKREEGEPKEVQSNYIYLRIWLLKDYGSIYVKLVTELAISGKGCGKERQSRRDLFVIFRLIFMY